jgi:hypothetical protein
MGVESKFYVLSDDSGYLPEPAAILGLIKSLQTSGFLCDSKSPSFEPSVHQLGSPNSKIENEGFEWRIGRNRFPGSLNGLASHLSSHLGTDLLIRWPNSDLNRSGLKYPLTIVPGPDGVYYDIETHFAADPVYHTSEIIDPFDEILCRCGAIVKEFEPPNGDPFYSSRLPNHCPACHTPINYALLPMTIRDGWTGEESKAVGGVTYRFAVVVDCGKYWPEQEATVTPEFLAVVEQTLQIKTRVVRDFY